MPDFREDLKLLKEAAREGGEIARHFYQSDVKIWTKDNNDPVTEADIAIDTLLREHLLSARPDYGWLSEETADNAERLTKKRVWIVDPIDGTRAFVKGRPYYSISLALVEDGRPVAGVIYAPATDDMYDAIAGGGAYLNDQAMTPSQQQEIPGCRMLGHEHLFTSKKWKNPWPPMTIEARNSIALRMALVAAGEWDACVALSGKSDWDLAAGDIILREAGADISDHTGKTFQYNRESIRHRSVVASNPDLHQALVDRVKHIPLK